MEQASSGGMRLTWTLPPFLGGENDFGGDALGLKRRSDFVLRSVIPARRLFFRCIRVHDGLVVPERVLE